MATGDSPDMAWRAYAVLPRRWFPDLEAAPVLRGVLTGIGTAWSFVFQLLAYARQQARIRTATGGFLDMIAQDFFANSLQRRTGEGDDGFRARVIANLLSEKATRNSVLSVVSALTAKGVSIFEPGRPADTGGYGDFLAPAVGGGCGYGIPGLAYGSLNLPFQFLLTVARPSLTADFLQVNGYGHIGDPAFERATGGYAGGAIQYASMSLFGDVVTDDEIRAAIVSTIPANSVAWLALT